LARLVNIQVVQLYLFAPQLPGAVCYTTNMELPRIHFRAPHSAVAAACMYEGQHLLHSSLIPLFISNYELHAALFGRGLLLDVCKMASFEASCTGKDLAISGT
jgi:hypothetical protein